MTGRNHETEPEADSLCFIGFEDDPSEGGPPVDQGPARLNWMAQAAQDVLAVAGRSVDRYLILQWFGWGEVEAWRIIGARVRGAGLDTYDSDSRFEVFDPEALQGWDS